MKHRVSDLEGALLDAAVAKAEGERLPDYWRDPDDGTCWARPGREEWAPSHRWDQGGQIIERELIAVYAVGNEHQENGWRAVIFRSLGYEGFDYIDVGSGIDGGIFSGATPLIAAMRAFCASKFGEEVELP